MSQPTKPAKPPAEVETKSLSVEIKADGEGTVTAYAAAFDNTDSWGDVLRKGAFLKTIRERKDKVKVLFNHRSWDALPVGKPLEMVEDTYGLLTTTKMSGTQLGQEIYTLAKEGALTEMSIGYQAIKAIYPEKALDYYRELLEVKLYEYSFVTFPANEQAVITSVKSAGDLEREIRRWANIAAVDLKAGAVLSGTNAKKILTALRELQDVLAAAGIDEAAQEGTSDDATGEKSSAEPREHSPLLSALRSHASTLEVGSRKSALMRELRGFDATLREGR